MTPIGHCPQRLQTTSSGREEKHKLLKISPEHRDILAKGATQDAAAAAASLQRLVMNLEFPSEGGLNRSMLTSMLNSICSLSDWEKASRLAGGPVARPSHEYANSQSTIPPDPGGGQQEGEHHCNCEGANTAETPLSTYEKRKEHSSDEDAESLRCSSGTKTEEDNERGGRKEVPPDRKRNRAAVRKYRQKKKEQRESLEVEVELLRKETERLRAQIDVQDASAALCQIWRAEAERLQQILAAMMQLVGVDSGSVPDAAANGLSAGPVHGLSSQALPHHISRQLSEMFDSANTDTRFDVACPPQVDPHTHALQQHSQIQALQQHHLGKAPALAEPLPSLLAHLHSSQLNGAF